MQAKILIVDDDDLVREVMAAYLEESYSDIDTAGSFKEALDLLESTEYDVIITDKNMPGLNDDAEGGMNLLRYAKKHLETTEVIMMTGYGTLDSAIEAMKLGAFDYVIKPAPKEQLREKIDRMLEYKSFINAEYAIQTYKALHSDILTLLEYTNDLPDEKLHEFIKSFDSKIDHFFRAQKQRERTMLIQGETLEKIAASAEELKRAISPTDPCYSLVEKICEESNRPI